MGRTVGEPDRQMRTAGEEVGGAGDGRAGRRIPEGVDPNDPDSVLRYVEKRRAEADALAAIDVDMDEEEMHREARERRVERRNRERYFDESLDLLLPLEPSEVRRFRKRRDDIEGAVEPGPATMSTQTRRLDVTPGAVPQIIRLTAGYASTLVFQDATGAPWPVNSMVLGSVRSFSATQPKVEQQEITEAQAASTDSPGVAAARAAVSGQTHNTTSNVVSLVPLTNHASSNLVVTLEGAPYPVVLHLLTESSAKDGRVADALVVLRLDKAGPNAKRPELHPKGPNTVSDEMLGIVHGIPPSGARRIGTTPKVPGVAVWEAGGKRYLRTAHALVWPSWSASADGEDVRVYLMPKVPSMVLSIDGRQRKFLLESR
jgi:intracellular multiplication protein IcmK